VEEVLRRLLPPTKEKGVKFFGYRGEQRNKEGGKVYR